MLSQKSRAISWLPYAALGAGAAVFLSALFFDVPIGTEARDYVFYRGFLPQLNWIGLIYPVGTNQRLISLAAFALGNDICGLGAECLNGLQILLLLFCLALGALHLHQLLRRPGLVALCSGFWCFSLPMFEAGYWQATQHDKLACLFSLAALSLGLAAIRRGGGAWFVAGVNLALTGLFLLALNSKEIAFFLPAAVVAQLVFLAPEPGLRGRVHAAWFYALPMAYAVCFIGIYMKRLNAAWQGYVTRGDPLTGAAYYIHSLMGGQYADARLFFLALAVVAAFSFLAVLRRRSKGAGPWAYLLVIFAANLVLVIRVQYPDNFYLLLAGWAFTGWIGACFALLATQAGNLRWPGMAVVVLLACVMLEARTSDLLRGGSAELLREARAFHRGYLALKPFCGARMQGGVKFVFAERPLGLFYFFRGGRDGPDQLVGRFICQDGTAPAMDYAFDGIAKPDHPGQLVVKWTPALQPVVP